MSLPAIEGGVPVRSKEDILVFGQPDINEDDIEKAVEVLRSGWISTGPVTTQFENEFAKYSGAEYAVATNSCTAALHLALMSLELPPGSEVITTDMTFCATVNAIIHAGLTPVIADCQKGNGNISLGKMERKITNKTRVLLPVHLAGNPCDMFSLREIADEHNLVLISDSAHAIETTYDYKSMAELSDISCYSFYATKNICTAEGGMLLTNNRTYAERARKMSLHGMSKNASMRYSSNGFNHYSIDVLGYKYNMTDIAAALGLSQLSRIEENWKKRQMVWWRYSDAFENLPVSMDEGWAGFTLGVKHAYHLFRLHLNLDRLKENRDFILNAIQAENVTVGVHYKAIHTHPYYQRTFGWKAKDFPSAQWMSDRTISLPLSSGLTDKDVDDVIKAIVKVLTYYEVK